MVEGDPHASAPSSAAEVTGETVEHALQSAFDLYGPDMLYAAERLRTFLKQRCPSAESDVALVMSGLDEQVPQALLSAHTVAELKLLVPRLQSRLTDQRSLNRYAAVWVVNTWADALRLQPETAAPAAAAPGPDDLRPPAASSGAADPPAAAAVAAAATSGVQDAVGEVPTPAPVAEPGADARVAPPPPEADLPQWAATDDVDDPEPLPAVRSTNMWYGIGAAIVAIVVIVFAIRYQRQPSPAEVALAPAVTSTPSPAAPAPSTAATAPDATATRPSANTAPAPPAAPAGSNAPSVPAGSGEPGAGPSSATNGAPGVASPSNTSPGAAPASTPILAPAIADVASAEPLIGDGKQRPLYLTLKAPGSDVRSVASRFVSGDPLLRAPPAVVDATGKTGDDGRVPAGTIGVRTTKPVKATYEFVATFADGRQSAPFEKQLTVDAAPVAPPAITHVTVPRAIVAGEPFWLTIAYEPGSGKLATIDRSILVDNGRTPSKVTSVAVSSLEKSDDGALILPIRSARAGAGTTMELTLVDAGGRRSAPQRIVFDVAPAAATSKPPDTATHRAETGSSATNATTTATLDALALGAKGGAVANAQPTAPPRPAATRSSAAACTPATCGSVVAVNEIPSSASRPQSANPAERTRRSYEILVRTDDRKIHPIYQSSPQKTGARVRLDDGKVLPLATPAAPAAARREARLLPESVPVFGQ